MPSMNTATLACSCGATFTMTGVYPNMDVAGEAQKWSRTHTHTEPQPVPPIELVAAPRMGFIGGSGSRRARTVQKLREGRRL